MSAKKLTEAQVKILRDMATSGGTSGPPGGYREAGRDASRWWGSIRVLVREGFVERISYPSQVHKLTKAGCLAIGLENGVSNLGFPEDKKPPKLALDMNDPQGIVNVDDDVESREVTLRVVFKARKGKSLLDSEVAIVRSLSALSNVREVDVRDSKRFWRPGKGGRS